MAEENMLEPKKIEVPTEEQEVAAEEKKETEKVKKTIETVAKTLDVELPKGHLLPIRIIALLTLLGGLSIAGSAVTDIIHPAQTNFFLYLVRVSIGVTSILIAYGIIIRQRWALWLYAILVFIALMANAPFAVIPLIIVFYLFTQRRAFKRSVLDDYIDSAVHWVKHKIGTNSETK